MPIYLHSRTSRGPRPHIVFHFIEKLDDMAAQLLLLIINIISKNYLKMSYSIKVFKIISFIETWEKRKIAIGGHHVQCLLKNNPLCYVLGSNLFLLQNRSLEFQKVRLCSKRPEQRTLMHLKWSASVPPAFSSLLRGGAHSVCTTVGGDGQSAYCNPLVFIFRFQERENLLKIVWFKILLCLGPEYDHNSYRIMLH